MHGEAVFTPDRVHRLVLWREWGEPNPVGLGREPFLLFIGMNPSVAAETVNDPTCAREIGFTRREGYPAYMKTNVMDYCCTNPSGLLKPGVTACSEFNLLAIHAAATDYYCLNVVLAFGTLPEKLRPYARRVISALRDSNITLHCLGTSKDGSPRHPLYLRSDTPFVEWTGEI